MEFDRCVQVLVSIPGEDGQGFGSGYLVGPRLVLTSAHVVGGDAADGSKVTVCRPDDGTEEFPATVRWTRQEGVIDAALLEIDESSGWTVPESLRDVQTMPPQRWGRFIGTRSHSVTSLGYPRMQKDPSDGQRRAEQLPAHVRPGTRGPSGRHELVSSDPTVRLGHTRWSGFSGAAVLSQVHGASLLCGVVCEDREAENGTRLTFTPAEALFEESTFREVVEEHGPWKLVLEPVEPAPLLAPAVGRRNLGSPTMLLRADIEAVTFHGRDAELASLRAWCKQGPFGLSVHVVTGPGGQGKSRLARHLAQALENEGWVTGHLRTELNDYADEATPDFALLETAHPLLLVVDYAETRPRTLRRLVRSLGHSRHRVRLLLLARSDGDWRTAPLGAGAETRDTLATAKVLELQPLMRGGADGGDTTARAAAFFHAASDLAVLLPLVPGLSKYSWGSIAAGLSAPADIKDSRYDNVLTLQMTALTSLLQSSPTAVKSALGAPAEEVLLRHEKAFWEGSARSAIFSLSVSAKCLETAVAIAALCGAANRTEALNVAEHIPGLPPEKRNDTVEWLAQLYPPISADYWGSLQPDRVAEYHASTVLAGFGTSGSNGPVHGIGGGEAAGLLSRLLAVASASQQAQVVLVLTRAALAHYDAGRAEQQRYILRQIQAACASAGLRVPALETVTAAMPYPSHVTAPLATAFMSALVEAYKESDNRRGSKSKRRRLGRHSPDIARLQVNRCLHLAEMGQLEDALQSVREAAKIYERLVKHDPGYTRPLGIASHHLGNRLLAQGRGKEALQAGQAAVAIRSRLAEQNPAVHRSDLAVSQLSLGQQLSATGRVSEALRIVQVATSTLRELVEENPSAYEPDYAAALQVLAHRLADVGQDEEALAAAQEALAIRRGLAAQNPSAHEPALERTLNNVSAQLSKLGLKEEALKVAKQRIPILRRLVAANPAAHESELALTLGDIAFDLAHEGREMMGEALAAEQEATKVWLRLAARHDITHIRRLTFISNLANSYSSLGVYLWQTDHAEEAVEAATEAVAIRRRLIAQNPAESQESLAVALTNLGTYLAGTGREEEALAAGMEAISVWRTLAVQNPPAFLLPLAGSLTNISPSLMRAGRTEDALSHTEEAVTICGLAALDDPVAASQRAVALDRRATLLAEAHRPEEALVVADEAIEAYKKLEVSGSPLNLGKMLRSARELQMRVLTELGRTDDAAKSRQLLADETEDTRGS